MMELFWNAPVGVSASWTAVAKRSGDTAFGRAEISDDERFLCVPKRRGAPLPAAVHDDSSLFLEMYLLAVAEQRLKFENLDIFMPRTTRGVIYPTKHGYRKILRPFCKLL